MFRLRTTRPRLTIALPALIPMLSAIVAVKSVTLPSTDLLGGGTGTGTVTLNETPTIAARVALSSSKPTLATVPASISIGRVQRGSFQISTVAGQAGCSIISASVGTTGTRSALLFVQPKNSSTSPVRLTLSPTSVAGGVTATGTVIVTSSSAAGRVVNLSSSNPTVTVPASVTLAANEMGIGIASFNIGTSTVTGLGTCSVITATFGTSQGRALLKVTPLFQG